MAQTKYQVSLSVDGKHAVSVQSDDPAAATEALVWANDTYKKLVRLSQTGSVKSRVELDEPGEIREAIEPEEAPICANHAVPMVWQKGRKGYFWSCHEKNPDVSWCSYRAPQNHNV
jgi:hypothetical protein